MTEPYVFKFHETDHPDRVATFMLEGDWLQMDLLNLFLPPASETPLEGEAASDEEGIPAALEPVIKRLAGSLAAPVHLKDVKISLDGDRLTVSLWRRARGLRLAPMVIVVSPVSDPEVAEAFIEELNARAQTLAHPGRFVGPFDYWAAWAGLGLGIAGLFGWLISRRKRS